MAIKVCLHVLYIISFLVSHVLPLKLYKEKEEEEEEEEEKE